MSATLLSMEKEVLEEGREWTRRRFQERLQKQPMRSCPCASKAVWFSSGSKR